MAIDEKKLFDENKGLVFFLVKKFFGLHADKNELYQEGLIELWKAAKRFQPEKGASFPTYATNCIMKRINKFLKNECKPKETINFCDLEEFEINELMAKSILPLSANENLELFFDVLTESERDLLTAKKSGKSFLEISKELNITHQAVCLRYKGIIRKLYKFRNDFLNNENTAYLNIQRIKSILNPDELKFLKIVNSSKSQKAAAQILGLSVGTVKTKKCMLLKKLKERLYGNAKSME